MSEGGFGERLRERNEELKGFSERTFYEDVPPEETEQRNRQRRIRDAQAMLPVTNLSQVFVYVFAFVALLLAIILVLR